jgi:hypothetical protein
MVEIRCGESGERRSGSFRLDEEVGGRVYGVV